MDRALNFENFGTQMRGRLQLVGVTCMFIASKYEEIFAPRVEDFVYITDSTYSETEVLQMEVTGTYGRVYVCRCVGVGVLCMLSVSLAFPRDASTGQRLTHR